MKNRLRHSEASFFFGIFYASITVAAYEVAMAVSHNTIVANNMTMILCFTLLWFRNRIFDVSERNFEKHE